MVRAQDFGHLCSRLRTLTRAILPGGRLEFRNLDLTMFRHELKAMMQSAAKGILTYGPAPDDVEKMAVVTDVLEMRLPDRRTASNDRIHARLYFTEPEERADLLLSLMVAWKSPGQFGLTEQNGHAITAQRRYDNWVGERGDALPH